MPREDVARWIAGYERAWREPGTELLGDLFTRDAAYRQGPYEDWVTGLAAIEAMWDAERDGPDEAFLMTSEVLAVDGATAVARVEIWYGDRKVEVLPRLRGRSKHRIDYRHIIDWLVRKPGPLKTIATGRTCFRPVGFVWPMMLCARSRDQSAVPKSTLRSCCWLPVVEKTGSKGRYGFC